MDGPYPEVNPRFAVTGQARRELDEFLWDWHKKHSLTSAEYTHILSCVLSNFAGRLMVIERRQQPEEKPCPSPST